MSRARARRPSAWCLAARRAQQHHQGGKTKAQRGSARESSFSTAGLRAQAMGAAERRPWLALAIP
eukprot:7922440-Alexandrium_andersonii.AAC.1